MARLLCSLFVTALAAFAQYSMKPSGAPAADIAPAITAELQKQGVQIVGGDGKVYAEIWLKAQAPQGPETSETDVSWKTVPHGALVGAVRYPEGGKDRRGQTIKPGAYTLRFSYYPVDGAHQGAEPSRDFLILAPAAADQDPKATPSFIDLMAMSRKASGTNHPAGLAMWRAGSDFQEGLAQSGEDWVWSTKVGAAQISVVVAGINEHDK
jgi:hypothetical protein